MRHLMPNRVWESCRRILVTLLTLALPTAVVARLTRAPLSGRFQSAGGVILGVVTVLDQHANQSPFEGIRVELEGRSQESQPLLTLTDAAGHYEFKQLEEGTYTLRVNQSGFKPFSKTISLQANGFSAVDIALALDTVAEKIEVKEQEENVATQNSSPASNVNNSQMETLPLAQQKFRDVLPVVPGVIRTLDGRLSIRGASESQGMLEVDSVKTVDPVTGSFSIPVPIDAIQDMKVDKTPFGAENGGFSGGLTTIVTRPPPTNWFYKVKDFNVSLRGKNGRLVGISQATPRVSFGGPIGEGKRWSFSEVYEYDVRRDPVRGLLWPRNEIKSQGFNSFTRLQAILSRRHVFNADVNVFPMRTEFADITALIPQTASSDYDEKGVSAGFVDLYSFPSGSLSRIALRYTRFGSNSHGQGPADMLINPEGWAGNFFDSWTRDASQLEVYPTFQFASKKWLGRHELEAGLDMVHRSYRGNILSHPIQLLRQDGTLAEQISFTSNGVPGASATDVDEFLQDRWVVRGQLAIDVGARLTSETVGRHAAFAPRLGLAYSPGKSTKTVFRAGAGLFYDRVSLLSADFVHNPERTVSIFDEEGNLLATTLYQNVYVGSGVGPIPSRVRSAPDSSPRSFVGSLEVDQQLQAGTVLRISYIYSQTRDLFIVSPVENVLGSGGLLGLFPTGQTNYHEFEATLHCRLLHRADLNISYIWSRTRGDLNTVPSIFLPFEQPVIRPNVSSILPSDVPNRLVSWGAVHLPWSITISPIVDVHTGFPYSNVDERQRYVGIPNGHRFPTFFSLDGQIFRDFHLPLPFLERGSRHKVRVGLYSINLTNHGNFHDVYNNVTSPFFGEFTGFQRRVNGFILSFAD